MVRARFRGRVTYAAIPVERVDWTPFDIMSVELIRSAEVAGQFREGIRSLVAGGKPVAITGFGTAAYRGAGGRGGRVMEILEYDEGAFTPVRLNGSTSATRLARPRTWPSRWRSSMRRASTAPSCSSSRSTAFRPAPMAIPVSTWIWPAWASSNAEGPQRRYLPQHGLGAQGRLHRRRRVLPQLTASGNVRPVVKPRCQWLRPLR